MTGNNRPTAAVPRSCWQRTFDGAVDPERTPARYERKCRRVPWPSEGNGVPSSCPSKAWTRGAGQMLLEEVAWSW